MRHPMIQWGTKIQSNFINLKNEGDESTRLSFTKIIGDLSASRDFTSWRVCVFMRANGVFGVANNVIFVPCLCKNVLRVPPGRYDAAWKGAQAAPFPP